MIGIFQIELTPKEFFSQQ